MSVYKHIDNDLDENLKKQGYTFNSQDLNYKTIAYNSNLIEDNSIRLYQLTNQYRKPLNLFETFRISKTNKKLINKKEYNNIVNKHLLKFHNQDVVIKYLESLNANLEYKIPNLPNYNSQHHINSNLSFNYKLGDKEIHYIPQDSNINTTFFNYELTAIRIDFFISILLASVLDYNFRNKEKYFTSKIKNKKIFKFIESNQNFIALIKEIKSYKKEEKNTEIFKTLIDDFIENPDNDIYLTLKKPLIINKPNFDNNFVFNEIVDYIIKNSTNIYKKEKHQNIKAFLENIYLKPDNYLNTSLLNVNKFNNDFYYRNYDYNNYKSKIEELKVFKINKTSYKKEINIKNKGLKSEFKDLAFINYETKEVIKILDYLNQISNNIIDNATDDIIDNNITVNSRNNLAINKAKEKNIILDNFRDNQRLLIHSITAGYDYNRNIKVLNNIFKYNGLKSQKEKRELGINLNGLAPIGDAANGVDIAVASNITIHKNIKPTKSYYNNLDYLLSSTNLFNPRFYDNYHKKYINTAFNPYYKSCIYIIIMPEILLRNDILFSRNNYKSQKFINNFNKGFEKNADKLHDTMFNKKIKHLNKRLHQDNEVWFKNEIALNDIYAIVSFDNRYNNIIKKLNKKYNTNIKTLNLY